MVAFHQFEEYLVYLYLDLINSDTQCLCNIDSVTSDSITSLYDAISCYLSDITSNDDILIKTSVTGNRNRNHEIYACLLYNILKFIREKNPLNKIYLCDGPAYEYCLANEYKRLEWNAFLSELNVDILDLNYGEVVMVDDLWPVSSYWVSASKVINLCKAKTHSRLGVTLSSKNLIGTLSGRFMGYPKLKHQHEHLQRIMYNLVKCRSNNMLNIIDGYYGIEGNGPMKGRIANSNFIVYGTNAFLCDIRAMIEMGFHPLVTQYAIAPLECMQLKANYRSHIVNKKLCNLRQSSYDYLPSIYFPWMYKSLSYDEQKIRVIYNTLLKVTIDNWNNYPKKL